MKSHNQHHPKQSHKAMIILIMLFVIIAGYTAYQGYRYWFAPRTIIANHFLIVDVITDRNITMEEALGYETQPSKLTYVIIQTGSIYFYKLSPGLNMTRELGVENIWNVPVTMKASATGELAPFLTIEPSETTLEPKGNITLNLTVKIPTESKALRQGQYKGTLEVKLIP